MKIAELIESYRNLDKSTKKGYFKTAFVPNPDVVAQQQQQAAASQQGMPPQQGIPPQQGMPPQQPTDQQMPPQQGMPPQQPAAPQQGTSPLMEELMHAVSQLPPEVQQQIMPLIQKIMAMPPEESEQYLQSLLQQMMAIQQQGQTGPMEAQAAEDTGGLPLDSYMPQQEAVDQEAENAEASAVEAKNELDNVRVNLSVRELLDLIGKGSATASLLKVKQLADSHKQKMEQIKQKTEADQSQKAQQQAAQQNSMMSGGIYPSPMDGGATQ